MRDFELLVAKLRMKCNAAASPQHILTTEVTALAILISWNLLIGISHEPLVLRFWKKITLPMWKRMTWTMVLLWMHSGLGSFALFFIRFWKTTPAVMLVFKCSQVFYIVHCMNGFFWWWWMVRPSYPPILSSHYESLCFHNLVFLLERCLFFPSAASWKPSCAEQGLLFIIYFKNLYLAPVT